MTLGNLYSDQSLQVTPDYEYDINNLKNEINNLKNQIETLKQQVFIKFPPVNQEPEDYEPSIFAATENGKLTTIQYIIEHDHFPVNQIGPNGDSLLHIACFKGYLPIIIYLIEQQKADIELKSGVGNTPLLNACAEEGHIYVFQYLVEKYHANIHAKNKHGRSCLHLACAYGHVILADYLINKFGFNIEEEDNEGNTPLHRAAVYGKNTLIIIYLLSIGANKNAVNKRGLKPIDVICTASKDQTNYSAIYALLE